MNQGLGYFLGHLLDKLHAYFTGMPPGDMLWLGIGLVGQTLFMMRFIVQWVASEKQGKSVIPDAFWYFSLIGGLTVLAYGMHKLDPVIVLGQLPGTFVYARNLMLIKRERSVL